MNCACAQHVGGKVLEGMVGETTAQHTFKKKTGMPPSNSNTINVIDDVIQIDPQLLFQRLVTAGQCKDNLVEVFPYELFSYPPAIFENKFTPSEDSKATLADALWKIHLEIHQCPAKKSNTTSALLQLTTDIAVGFNQRKPQDRTVCMGVDLSAAFDTVCQPISASSGHGSPVI